MEKLISQMENIGFSKLEAMTYAILVQKGALTGYQIAKTINISRASIYPVLDSLYKRGIVQLLPGDTNIYTAEQPEIIIEKIREKFNSSADIAKYELANLTKLNPKDRYTNLEGYDNIINKIKELLLSAEKEVLMHTDFDLFTFEKEFKAITAKGVRIIVFSWSSVDVKDLPIEFFTRSENSTCCYEERMMMVVDFKKALLGSNSNTVLYKPPEKVAEKRKIEINKADFLGTFSENRLMVHIVTEHIHFDIYLIKLMEKYKEDIIDSSVQLGTLMEKGEE